MEAHELSPPLTGRAARMAVPTTEIERHVDPRQPIVTKTDLKGKITYANPAFVKISGYSRDELIGQPHNVVRHPDMPREAFEDLWRTVRAGVPWRGRVKNRCKDGAFYWVDAYVTPLYENGERVGYMSVRTAPSLAAKEEAQALYSRVRGGQATLPKTSLRAGRSVSVDIGIVMALMVAGSAAAVFMQSAVATGLVGIVLLGVAAAGWLWINRVVREPLARMRRAMRALGEGNFNHDIDTGAAGEFAKVLVDLKSMQVNLKAIVSDVVSAAHGVKEDAANVNTQAVNLMNRSEQQSDGITSVAAALEELSVSVSEISEATNSGSRHAGNALSVVGEGTQRMRQATSATEKVVATVDRTQRTIAALGEAVARISSVTQTITDVAEKTNLLALNAAIEAARAGESGRGFAVVADEVRKLAELTQNSTTEIAATVAGVQSGTQEALETMKLAVEEVDVGTGMIRGANASLDDIAQASRGVADSAQAIASMLDEQSKASTEVANSMQRMNVLTQSNMEAITEVTRAAQQLHATASALQDLVQHFEKRM